MRSRIPLASLVFAAVILMGASGPPVPNKAPNAHRGLALLQHFRDSLPQHSGNGLRCTSCHLDDGMRGTAMPWIGVTARYPKYRARRGSQESIEQRVNECIARSLAGRMLPEDDAAMLDIVAYLETLRDLPALERPDTVRVTGSATRGAVAYQPNCARCHGANGAGTVSAPAVFGAESYSVGAGLARQKVLATFLQANMPFDQPGSLDAQVAADIAAWVLQQPRQDYPGKERDWPNGDVPVDVAYATDGARRLGVALPPARPVLRRRVPPTTQRSR